MKEANKKIIAFLTALTTISANVPMFLAGDSMNLLNAYAIERNSYSLTQDLEDVKAAVGDSVVMTVAAEGTTSYQWQWSSDGISWNSIGNNNKNTFSFTMAERFAGRKYRCILNNGTDTIESRVATLSLKSGYELSQDLEDVNAAVGDSVVMTVAAEGTTSYQWQWSSDGISWNSIGNNNKNTFSFTMAERFAGRKYRCILNNGTDTIESRVATLSLKSGYELSQDLEDVNAAVGDSVVMTVAAEGTTSYQWQWSSDGISWNSIGNNNKNTFSFKMAERFAGRKYRCILNNGTDTIESKVATLSLKSGYELSQDLEDVKAAVGDSVVMTVAAEGTTSYQWQWSSDGISWNSIGNNNKNTFSFKMAERFAGRKYRCILSNGTDTIESKVATLSLKSGYELSQDLEDVNAAVGDSVVMTVAAEGTTSYQWQWSSDGISWNSIGNNNKNTFSFKMAERFAGRKYRCILSNGTDTIESRVATLSLKATLSITSPNSAIITTNQSATFTVSSETNIKSYAWEYKLPNSNNWLAYTGTGANTASITVAGSEATSGTQYRCTVTDNYGQTKTSDAATLTVRTPITISDLPSTTVVEGKNVSFSITATGENLTYQWQTGVVTDDDTPIDWVNIEGATSSTYTFKTKYTDDRRLYRCIVTDPYESVNSSVATLTVTPAYTVISNVTKEITINMGDAYQLDVTGTKLRYYSNTSNATVDKNGVVTAKETGTAYIFVLDNYGNKTFYKIHVVDMYEALAFDEPVVSVLPEESIRLYTNKAAYQMVSDGDKTSVYWDYYWNYYSYGEYADFTGYIPGTYNILAYTDDGEIATCEVNVEGDVTDAALNTPYTGTLTIDNQDNVGELDAMAASNKWYRYVNDTEDEVMVTFDVIKTEGNNIANADYAVYYKGRFEKSDWFNVEDYANQQIYLAPGEEVYVRPYINGDESVYNFCFNATAYNPMNYTLGTTVDNVVLDRKDYTEYEFTTNAAGGYVLNSSSLTSFYWQIEDVENNYETVQHDRVDSATMIPFNLKPNHKYAIRFTPQNMTEEGTLSFTLSKATDNIVNATVNTQYDSDILKAGKTTYYKYDLGDASYNAILDVYEFDQNYVDDVSYEVLGSDMVTPIEMFSSTNGYKFYTEEPTTVYIKVTNTSSSQRVPEFILRKYDRTMTQISGVDSGSNELPINTAQWYEFTAPQNGVYHFDFLSSQHDISVNYEIYFGDELNYSSDYSRYNDYTNWYYYYDEDNNYHEEYGLPNQLDLYYTLLEGEKVYIKVTGDFNANNASTIIPYRWSVSCQEAYPVIDLALDTPTAGATVDGQKQYFKFTAPKSGVYYFWSQTIAYMYGDLYDNLGGNYLAGDSGYGEYGNFCLQYHLKAGQTVYLCPRQYDNEDVKYEVVVSRTNNSAQWTPEFSHTALTLDSEVHGTYNDYYDYDTFLFTAPEAGTYIFNAYNNDTYYDLDGELYSDAALKNEVAYYSDSNNVKIQYELAAGQTVYFKPRNYYSSDYAEYTVKVTKRTRVEKDLLLGYTYNEALASESEAWYEFTAPFDGRYYYAFDSDSYISGRAYYVNADNSLTEPNVWGHDISQTTNGTIMLDMEAGQKAVIRIVPDDSDAAANYSLSLRCDIDDYEVQVLDIDADMQYSSGDYYFGRFTGWIQINSPTLCEGVLTVETQEFERALTVELYNANGVLITSGSINNDTDTITSVDFEDAFLDDDTIGYSVFFLKIGSNNGYDIEDVAVVFENASVQDGGLDD
ncbi:hypothetical protein [Ruminococcus flavefaciens]|uniref:hypothetical protein n=1 Tax=Ruminococcus flavefaciens TaxID=1265 RepID=UPI0004B3DD24|nr:hypothetical protein [Ruminococcus flavefaciens]